MTIKSQKLFINVLSTNHSTPHKHSFSLSLSLSFSLYLLLSLSLSLSFSLSLSLTHTHTHTRTNAHTSPCPRHQQPLTVQIKPLFFRLLHDSQKAHFKHEHISSTSTKKRHLKASNVLPQRTRSGPHSCCRSRDLINVNNQRAVSHSPTEDIYCS